LASAFSAWISQRGVHRLAGRLLPAAASLISRGGAYGRMHVMGKPEARESRDRAAKPSDNLALEF
jgi:hypothetical protein